MLHERAWDRSAADIELDIVAAIAEIPNADPTATLLDALSEGIPTDFSVGHILAAAPSKEIEDVLVAQLSGPNSRALLGYLLGCEERSPGAFDRFVDDVDIEDVLKLSLTTQGPRTERAVERVAELLPRMTVAAGARGVFFWARDLGVERVAEIYVGDWVERVETQEDYNALVDFVAMQLYKRNERSDAVENLILRVVALRVAFPRVGQQSYDWEQLAGRLVEGHAAQLVDLFIELVEDDGLRIFSDDRRGDLFRDAVEAAGPEAWRSILDLIDAGGSFRLRFRSRGWIAGIATREVAANWVGDSLDRARTLASVASVTGTQLSPIVKLLINGFGQDSRVRSALVGDFLSGSWIGNESARIERQISQIRNWVSDPSSTDAEKAFCRSLIEGLTDSLGRVVEQEQEEDW
ncbi:hypothetical protein KIV56_17250 [Cryobacterium breve]|uniref:HEAT repeat domain-containing protein n=1 Tax=Cryobacterium breve TaxID=1259258 RepID=A0ABY7NBL0_9MICO|nr:hypothetical protein [Cryobacterium breve]WBM79892.1 hypothetical protein KIV56_17250 [Cryobacterium breve]